MVEIHLFVHSVQSGVFIIHCWVKVWVKSIYRIFELSRSASQIAISTRWAQESGEFGELIQSDTSVKGSWNFTSVRRRLAKPGWRVFRAVD